MLSMVRIPSKNEWANERVFIIGGGPSLNSIDVQAIKGKGRVIVTNNAYKLAPWADWLVFADQVWYEWHKDTLKDLSMPIITGAIFGAGIHVHPNVLKWPTRSKFGLVPENGRYLTGHNAGHMALSLAEYLGSKTIILLGFDMKEIDGKTQWHNEHKRPSVVSMYTSEFIPAFEETAILLEERGVQVYNVNSDSALRCFPFVDFQKSLDI